MILHWAQLCDFYLKRHISQTFHCNGRGGRMSFWKSRILQCAAQIICHKLYVTNIFHKLYVTSPVKSTFFGIKAKTDRKFQVVQNWNRRKFLIPVAQTWNWSKFLTQVVIPDICNFFYTDRIFWISNFKPKRCENKTPKKAFKNTPEIAKYASLLPLIWKT